MPKTLNTQLTKKQAQLFDYLDKFQERKNYSPALSDMANHFGVSIPTIHQHVDYLERKGYLIRQKGVKNSIRVLKTMRELVLSPVIEEIKTEDIENTNEQKIHPYFKENDFTLYLGNCLDVLTKLPANSINVVFADPPYNLSNDGFSLHAGKRVSVNKGVWDKSKGFEDDYNFHYKWLNACKRVLKPGGTLWVSGTYHSIYQCGYALQSLGYHILNDISWFKPNA